jgi:hypothetical protein
VGSGWSSPSASTSDGDRCGPPQSSRRSSARAAAHPTPPRTASRRSIWSRTRHVTLPRLGAPPSRHQPRDEPDGAAVHLKLEPPPPSTARRITDRLMRRPMLLLDAPIIWCLAKLSREIHHLFLFLLNFSPEMFR